MPPAIIKAPTPMRMRYLFTDWFDINRASGQRYGYAIPRRYRHDARAEELGILFFIQSALRRLEIRVKSRHRPGNFYPIHSDAGERQRYCFFRAGIGAIRIPPCHKDRPPLLREFIKKYVLHPGLMGLDPAEIAPRQFLNQKFIRIVCEFFNARPGVRAGCDFRAAASARIRNSIIHEAGE